jgi:hypothetical protein
LKSDVKCDHWIIGREFDPFSTCDEDEKLIEVRCSFACQGNPKKGIPTVYETCVYSFDKDGAYGMSFDEIEVCHLDAECESPYVEKNLLHCYSAAQGREHNPWEVTGWGSMGRDGKGPGTRVNGQDGQKSRPIFKRNAPIKEGLSMWTYLVYMLALALVCGIIVNCFCRSRRASQFTEFRGLDTMG